MIRIGTRKSELAQWQAKLVQEKLLELGTKSELVLVDSYGDANLKQPLYNLGVVGVFTKSLDVALLNNKIDIAVHSMKDVPVDLPTGIGQFAVLERGRTEDVIVKTDHTTHKIATSSLRRKAQWLCKHPDYSVEDIRGNVNTRLKKVKESDWEGAIFALAGLQRLDLNIDRVELLKWMIPAPAQGALMVTGRTGDMELEKSISQLSHAETLTSVTIERNILKLLEGGCSAPIGILANIKDNTVLIKAGVFAIDGSDQVIFEGKFSLSNSIDEISHTVHQILIEKGANKIISDIKL